ncbi:glycosyltransferase [Corynebacterium minutissimum]
MDVSVVIGFRDWGIQRLRLAVTSIQRSFNSIDGEVVLSDYGSLDRTGSEELAAELGISYVYTSTNGPWSRSRALNAGFAAATGDFLVSTDADMVFSPRAFEKIVQIAKANPTAAYFLQCRDLPEHMTDAWVAENPSEWSQMEAESRLRPRWGMGGMMAISRSGFNAIRGFDERLHTYGGEDLDFAQRARRAGYKTLWIEDPGVRMYHMWHPPTAKIVAETAEGVKAVEDNRDVVYNDKTFVRNFTGWSYRPEFATPLVTVAIATKDRADIISETIQSVLFQSVQDFEIVVVDDGGTDNLEEVLQSFEDPRIRYFHQEQKGISAARNKALDVSRGLYTAVIDDDDLMHPRRLEWHLEALAEGLDGNVGSFLNFQDDTGELELQISMVPTVYTAFEKGGAPGHGTWFISTDVLRRFRYDESISSGVDNNIMLRMLRAGVRLGHTGKPVTLRRQHSRQVTRTDSKNQSDAAVSALSFFKWNLNDWTSKKLEEERSVRGAWPKIKDRESLVSEARTYLPDHLIERTVEVYSDEVIPQAGWDGTANSFSVEIEGVGKTFVGKISRATFSDMVKLRQLGIDFSARPEMGETPVSWLASVASLMSEKVSDTDYVVICRGEDCSLDNDFERFSGCIIKDGSQTAFTALVMPFDAEVEPPAGSFVLGPTYLGVK